MDKTIIILILAALLILVAAGCRTAQLKDNTPSKPPRGMRYDDISDFPSLVSFLDSLSSLHRSDDSLGDFLGEAKELEEAFARLNPDFPEQQSVAEIKDLKKRVHDYLMGAPYVPIIYDFADNSATPDRLTFTEPEGTALFKTNSGGVDPWFGYASYNPFTTHQMAPIEMPKGKSAFFVVDFKQIQTRLNRIPIILGHKGRITSAAFMTLETVAPANLFFQVDDPVLGENVPFLVDIVRVSDGKHIVPENAIDFRSQMDPSAEPVYGFENPSPQNFPGELKSRYYVVPGRIEQNLPPGNYRISVRRGIEHYIHRETLELKPGELLRKTVLVDRWANMREEGWISGEGHMHGKIMSGSDARRLLKWTIAADVHVTNVLFMGNFMQTWFDQRGFGRDFRAELDGYWIIPGQEDPRGWGGHVVGHNISELVRHEDDYLSYRNIYDQIHEQDGVVGGAHVLSGPLIQGDRVAAMDIPWGRLDYFEILQVGGMDTEIYYDALDLGFPMSPGSGTDIPWHGSIGEGRMYVYTGSKEADPDQWFRGLREGRVFISNSAMIEMETDTGAGPGQSVTYSQDGKTVTITGRAASRGDGQYISKLELVAHSEVVASAEISPESTDAVVSVTLPVEKGFWCALRAETSDGGFAHTSPVYIVREGYRFWNRKKLPGLVGKYASMLDMYAADIRNDIAVYEQNKGLGPDLYAHKRGEQGPEFLEEIAETKAAYENLLADLQKEL